MRTCLCHEPAALFGWRWRGCCRAGGVGDVETEVAEGVGVVAVEAEEHVADGAQGFGDRGHFHVAFAGGFLTLAAELIAELVSGVRSGERWGDECFPLQAFEWGICREFVVLGFDLLEQGDLGCGIAGDIDSDLWIWHCSIEFGLGNSPAQSNSARLSGSVGRICANFAKKGLF